VTNQQSPHSEALLAKPNYAVGFVKSAYGFVKSAYGFVIPTLRAGKLRHIFIPLGVVHSHAKISLKN